jgi:hypothetical protein
MAETFTAALFKAIMADEELLQLLQKRPEIVDTISRAAELADQATELERLKSLYLSGEPAGFLRFSRALLLWEAPQEASQSPFIWQRFFCWQRREYFWPDIEKYFSDRAVKGEVNAQEALDAIHVLRWLVEEERVEQVEQLAQARKLSQRVQ